MVARWPLLIETIKQRLQAELDEVFATVDAPRDTENGFWFLNVSCWGRDVLIEWSRRHGYRIVYREECGCGPGRVHEELFLSNEADRVFTRVVVVLSGPRYLKVVRG